MATNALGVGDQGVGGVCGGGPYLPLSLSLAGMATNVLGVGDPGVWDGGGCGGSYLPLSLSLAGMATNALGVGDQGVGGVCGGGLTCHCHFPWLAWPPMF